jgi:hypothetical protein
VTLLEDRSRNALYLLDVPTYDPVMRISMQQPLKLVGPRPFFNLLAPLHIYAALIRTTQPNSRMEYERVLNVQLTRSVHFKRLHLVMFISADRGRASRLGSEGSDSLLQPARYARHLICADFQSPSQIGLSKPHELAALLFERCL